MEVRYIRWRWDAHQTSADEVMLYPNGFDFTKRIDWGENIVDLWTGEMWTGDSDANNNFYLKPCGMVDASKLDNLK